MGATHFTRKKRAPVVGELLYAVRCAAFHKQKTLNLIEVKVHVIGETYFAITCEEAPANLYPCFDLKTWRSPAHGRNKIVPYFIFENQKDLESEFRQAHPEEKIPFTRVQSEEEICGTNFTNHWKQLREGTIDPHFHVEHSFRDIREHSPTRNLGLAEDIKGVLHERKFVSCWNRENAHAAIGLVAYHVDYQI